MATWADKHLYNKAAITICEKGTGIIQLEFEMPLDYEGEAIDQFKTYSEVYKDKLVLMAWDFEGQNGIEKNW